MHTDWDTQRERLSAYLDGEVSAEERATLAAHLAGCAECQRELAALRQTKALLAALPVPALPRSFALPEKLRPLPAPRAVAPRWSRPLQALGGLAAMIGVGFLITTAAPHIIPSAQGGASYASSASYGNITTGAEATAGTGDGTTAGAAPSTATPKGTGTSSGIEAPAHSPAHSAPGEQQVTEPFPFLPVTGGVLLVGGAAALTIGSLARRRSRGARLPESAA